jgi:anti-anti-sigma factor
MGVRPADHAAARYDPGMFETGEARCSEIEVEVHPTRAPGFTVVRLSGEHDLATSLAIRAALSSIDGNVLLDLSDCEFVDSSVLRVLVEAAEERAPKGQRLELLVPDENERIARTLQISGLDGVLTSRASLEST